MSYLLADQLSTINSVFKNTIEQKCVNINTQHIQSELFLHQKLMVNSMNLHHLRMTHGYMCNNQVIHGKLGIIADPPGTGKTLSILSFISLIFP